MESTEYDSRVGHRLRNVRESRGLTRKDVETATDSEFKESILAMYENGRRRIPVARLKRLADHYRVSPALLIGEESLAGNTDVEALLMADATYSREEKDLLFHVINIIKAKRKAEGKE